MAAWGGRLYRMFDNTGKGIKKQYQSLKTYGAKIRRNVWPRSSPKESEALKEVEVPSETIKPLLEPESRQVQGPLNSPILNASGAFSGRGMWIWRMVQAEDGQLQRIIEKAKLAGLDWVAIKAANGTSHWVQFNSEVIRKIQEVGIKVFGWVYAYGNNPQNEAEVAKGVLRLGCDGLIIDAEKEYEGKPAAAERYLSLIRAANPNAFIAYSSFPIISKHFSFPFAEFGRYCDVSLPQCYWRMMGYTPESMMERVWQEWDRWAESMKDSGQERSVIPVLPVGQGFNVETEEIRRFVEASKAYSGISLWEWSQISQDGWYAYSKSEVDLPLNPKSPKLLNEDVTPVV